MSEPKGERSEDFKVFEELFGASLQSLCISRFTEYLGPSRPPMHCPLY